MPLKRVLRATEMHAFTPQVGMAIIRRSFSFFRLLLSFSALSLLSLHFALCSLCSLLSLLSLFRTYPELGRSGAAGGLSINLAMTDSELSSSLCLPPRLKELSHSR